jgi:hypothetical protein
MCARPDSQEVGLEAAILERVRNSSLVECACADNVTGLSLAPKLRKDPDELSSGCLVGERPVSGEGQLESWLERAGVRMSARVA